jgi:hypothetical protein
MGKHTVVEVSAVCSTAESSPLVEYNPRSDKPPLIPEGKYKASCIDAKYGNMFGKQPKVSLVFAIIDPPSFFGCKLVRHYNCLWSGRNDKQKRIKPGWRGGPH